MKSMREGENMGMDRKEEPGELACGRRLRKRFGKRYFYGVISSYDPTYKWYKVKYEDGDREELWWHEVEPLLMDPSSQNEPSFASQSTSSRRTSDGKKRRKTQSQTSEDDTDKENADTDTSALLYDRFVHVIGSHLLTKEDEEIYGWGELTANDHTTPTQLKYLSNLLVPMKLLTATRHHTAVLDMSGQVYLYRSKHGNIRSRCDQWERIAALDQKNIIFIQICGWEIDRGGSGYHSHQEDQIPDPFYLVALDSSGKDHILYGSLPHEKIRTVLDDGGSSLHSKLSLFHPHQFMQMKDERILHLSVGTVTAMDEPPFIGYITSNYRVVIRGATKKYFEEINFVSGFSSKPIKIQCGSSFHAIILTDDGKAWTWGISPSQHPSPSSPSSPFTLRSESKFLKEELLLYSTDFSICTLAKGSLEGKKVIDVGCSSNKFVALTRDGMVHYWSHAPNTATNYKNNPPIPIFLRNGPRVERPDKLVKIYFSDGVCAGVTLKGDLHTWRVKLSDVDDMPDDESKSTPLGRREGSDTQVMVRGVKEVSQALVVPGSLLFVAKRKESRKKFE